MSPARMLSRLNNSSNTNKMTQSSPGRAAPSPIRAMSAGRSSSRTKSRDATNNNSAVHKTKQQTTNSVEEGLTVQGVEFVPLMITHTMSKPSPSRKQQHHRSSVGASPARSVTSSSYHEITTKGEVQHHRVTSGSANDFFANNNNNNNGTAVPAIAASSPARTHQRIPSGGSISIPTTSYNNYNNDMSGGRSHKRVPSSGSVPTLYSNGSNRSHHSGQSKSHHSRAPSAGSVPASSYYSGGSANSPVMQQMQYQDYGVGHGATTPQRQYHQQHQQQQYQHQQQQQRVYNAPPPPPPPPKFEFEATPPSLIPTSPNQLPEGFFSSNSVYGDSTTMGGSSIDESLNGDDHMNDLLGVLNEEERGRYWRNDDGDGLMQQQQYGNGGNNKNGGGEYGANENDDRYNDNPASRRGYVEDRQEEQVSPRKQQQQQQQEREVRVSVVSPEKQRQQQQQRGKDSDEISTTIESPTSIFSVFNCGDITSDISETLSLIFSPTVKKQQQERELMKVPEDEEEEERLLMEKLQRLREKKWRGRSSSRPRARS